MEICRKKNDWFFYGWGLKSLSWTSKSFRKCLFIWRLCGVRQDDPGLRTLVTSPPQRCSRHTTQGWNRWEMQLFLLQSDFPASSVKAFSCRVFFISVLPSVWMVTPCVEKGSTLFLLKTAEHLTVFFFLREVFLLSSWID